MFYINLIDNCDSRLYTRNLLVVLLDCISTTFAISDDIAYALSFLQRISFREYIELRYLRAMHSHLVCDTILSDYDTISRNSQRLVKIRAIAVLESLK